MPGAIELKKGAEGYAAASPGTVLFGIDSSGNPITIDEEGVVRSSSSLDGSPMLLVEQVSDPTTDEGEFRIYSKRVDGVLSLYQRTEGNGPVTLLGGGGGALDVNWKEGAPGTPYVDGDTVDVSADQLVMIQVGDPGVVTLQFPSSAANPGKRITVVNMLDKKTVPGPWQITPFSGESIGSGSVDETVTSGDPTIAYCVSYVADGNGIWFPFAFSGPMFSQPA